MTATMRMSVAAIVSVVAALTLTGCNGGSNDSPTMACKDFLVLTADKAEVVWKAAAEAANRPEVATGGGVANGVSVCQDQPDTTVVEVAKVVSPY